jgi:hypothetical protein
MIALILSLVNRLRARQTKCSSGDLVGHSISTNMSSFTINGQTFTGNSIQIRDNRVIIDGVDINHDATQNKGIIEVRVLEGTIETLTSDRSVTAQDIGGSATAGLGLNCKNVKGNVTAGQSVNCENIGGSVKAGHSVNCGRVGGTVTAGHSVRRA